MKNTTRIFASKEDFYSREDQKANGVSQEFATEYPEYELQNETNDGCWNCSGCGRCRGCSDCSDCSDCRGCRGCSDCSDCSDCSGCGRCSDCSDCSGCSDCSDCSDLENASPVKNEDAGFKVPIIENIHTKILEAVSKDGALEMNDWHTCETTHCRAGWVCHLAGDEGKKLENKTSTLFAAMQIYHASSKIHVSPTRFFGDNKTAMFDIQRCASLERENFDSLK